ncbi:MAG: hypothetical protein J0H14_06915 [Alphaproteobacteria bacterium]|nr:hypothetical protein [Alphaproteobacteria bacterium]
MNAVFAAAAFAAHARPAVYLTHGSKIGLIAPTAPPVDADVIVDACQARIESKQVAAYLRRGWPVIDAAFGAIAMLSPALRPLFVGMERPNSVAFDFRKWAQVPYDAGCIVVGDAGAHRAAFAPRGRRTEAGRSRSGTVARVPDAQGLDDPESVWREPDRRDGGAVLCPGAAARGGDRGRAAPGKHGSGAAQRLSAFGIGGG